jgi:hypothetical protein
MRPNLAPGIAFVKIPGHCAATPPRKVAHAYLQPEFAAGGDFGTQRRSLEAAGMSAVVHRTPVTRNQAQRVE